MFNFTVPSGTSVLFGGSRWLSSVYSLEVARVVSFLFSGGFRLNVGCACGADQYALDAALRMGRSKDVSLFCAGAESGEGFWLGSAPLQLLRTSEIMGASVTWLAGGDLHIPLVPRLKRRSLASLAGCSAAVFFLASPSSSGSLSVAAQAAKCHLPVVVVGLAFSGSPLALRGCAGSWTLVSFAGFQSWLWTPAQYKIL